MFQEAASSLNWAISGMESMENSTLPELRFSAEAEIRNPNLLGGKAEPGAHGVYEKPRKP